MSVSWLVLADSAHAAAIIDEERSYERRRHLPRLIMPDVNVIIGAMRRNNTTCVSLDANFAQIPSLKWMSPDIH